MDNNTVIALQRCELVGAVGILQTDPVDPGTFEQRDPLIQIDGSNPGIGLGGPPPADRGFNRHLERYLPGL